MGSYFAIDSIQKLNVEIPEERYEQLKKSLEHIGFPMNDYAQFRRTGTVEKLWHYFSRTLVAQAFWCSAAYALGGVGYVVTWYAATYTLWFLLRDFGWRGHRGAHKRRGWEFHEASSATNQRFYGYLASEWHDNHHHFPNSANIGFLRSQFDGAFQLVKLMKMVGRPWTRSNARAVAQCASASPDSVPREDHGARQSVPTLSKATRTKE